MNPRASKQTKNRNRERVSKMYSNLLNKENTVRLDNVDRSLVGRSITTDGQWELTASRDTIEATWIALATNGSELKRIPFAVIAIGRDSAGRPTKVSAKHYAENIVEGDVIEVETFCQAANPLFSAICACVDRALD